MLLCTAVRQRIINIASERNITLHRLALDSGVPYSTLSSFMNGKSNSITLTTLLHLCEGANIELEEFFRDKLFKDVEAEDIRDSSTLEN